MARSYRTTPKLRSGCGGWGGSRAKRAMQRLYRRGAKEWVRQQWPVDALACRSPHLYEVVHKDVYQHQAHAYKRHWGVYWRAQWMRK